MLTIPGLCWLCRMPLAVPQWGICSCCRDAIHPPPCCPQCGLPALAGTMPCGRCLHHAPPWQRLVFVDDYRPPLGDLVKRFKFSGTTALGPVLARLLLLQILTRRREGTLPAVTMILAVPLHRHRAWRRGFNQSHQLAHYLSRWLKRPYYPWGIRRTRATAIQHFLPARRRRINLRRAFRLELSVRGHHIAIVDDVVTTGSTVAEIARLLKRNGAATVQIWCLCRTL